MLDKQKNNMISFSQKMINEIKKIMHIGLEKIRNDEFKFKVLSEAMNLQQLDRFLQNFQVVSFSKKPLKETIKNSILFDNSDCNTLLSYIQFSRSQHSEKLFTII